LYYLNDATGYVRQGADEQGQVTSNWLFDPDGTVLEGSQGPVSHLICGGVYDWSTGLIFKGGRYFDPSLGIWLALTPLVVLQSWRGRKRKRRGMPWYTLLLLAVFVGYLLAACGSDSGECNPNPIPPEKICTDHFPPDGVDPDTSYEDYGFVLGGFDAHKIGVLGVTIQAYADHVGGQEQLKKLTVCGDGGSLRPVCKDTINVGADADIRLGTTTFDVALAVASNYPDFGAANDDLYAQIIFGHEIGHNLISALRPTKDWTVEYQTYVPTKGDGSAWPNADQAEQEAVTNLALYVLKRSYRWNAYLSGPADPAREIQINDWAQNFLDDLKKY
jgi:hypothetical protein